jgi:hypothetical protein
MIIKELFERELKELLNTEKDSLVAGAVENYSEVQHIRGRISGLSTALQVFDDIWQKIVSSHEGLEEE